MQAIVLQKPFQFEQVEIAEANKPGPGEALVRVHRIGICGSDYSGYQGKMPFYGYPRIPGHELGVEVLEVGSGVTNVQPGQRCSVEPYINDPNSRASRLGFPNCCEKLEVLGVHRDGGMRPRFIVPARKLHPGGDLNYEQLALVETLAIGSHAVERGNCKPEETVIIIGTGPIGLSVLEFVRLIGSRVILMDTNEHRLAFARTHMGARETYVVKNLEEDIKAIGDMTNGHFADVVIDATGNNKSMSSALNFVGFTGRLVFVGITAQEVSFPHPLMHRREMTLLASRNATPIHFPTIIEHIRAGRINTRPWLTHEAKLNEVPKVFPDWLNPANGVLKAIVTVDDV